MNSKRQFGMGHAIISSDTYLRNDVSKAIIGEVHAYNFYEELAKLSLNYQYRQIIQRIQQDEAKHYHWFTMLLHSLGGQVPEVPPGEVPTSFKEGVRTAIQHELEAVAFYQDIASRASDRRIQMRFIHASNDEQRHAYWFQNMLNQL